MFDRKESLKNENEKSCKIKSFYNFDMIIEPDHKEKH